MRPLPRLVRVLATAVASVLVVSACTGDPTDTSDARVPPTEALERFYTQTVDWAPCGGGDCGTVTVPVNYDDPGGATVDVALFRHQKDGDDGPVKPVLFVNPGGPGGSGVQYATTAAMTFSRDLRDAYDIVGWDPRGVGRSAPIRCVDQATEETLSEGDPLVDDPGDVTELDTQARTIGEGCAANAGPLLGHVGTRDVARDLDVMRAALNQDELHYVGKSYGTVIGQVYAALFPTRAGRIVLDGPVRAGESSEGLNRAQARGFTNATLTWAGTCLDTGRCPLPGDTPEQVVDALFEYVRSLPETTDMDREPSQASVLGAVLVGMYEQAAWPALNQALQSAINGDGTQAAVLAKAATAGTDVQGGLAVNCLDRDRLDPAARETAATDLAAEFPVWGLVTGWQGAACDHWPVPADPLTDGPYDPAAGPFLVVGVTGDPATPVEYARELVNVLPDVTLVVAEGEGHTGYRRGWSCVDDLVDGWLIDGPDGVPPSTVCPVPGGRG